MDQDQEMVKTTIVISRDLWRRARIRAAHEDADFRTVVIQALEEFLATPPQPKARGRAISGPEAREIIELARKAKSKKGGDRR